jgi:hypothetical protein
MARLRSSALVCRSLAWPVGKSARLKRLKGDCGGEDPVTVDEILTAVNKALNGCE